MSGKRIGWPEVLGWLTGAAFGLIGAVVVWFAWDFLKHLFTAH